MVRKVAAFGLVLLVALVSAPGPSAANGTGGCATRIGEIPIGTGEAGIDVAALNLINHHDLVFPLNGCSRGAFYIDAGKSGLVAAKLVCAENVVRVWAAAGTIAEDFTVHFVAGGC